MPLGTAGLAVLSGLLLSLSLPPGGRPLLALVSWLPLLGAQYLLAPHFRVHASFPLAALAWVVFVLTSWSRALVSLSGSLAPLSWPHVLQAAVAGGLALLAGQLPGGSRHLGWWGPLQIVGLEKLRSVLLFPTCGPAWAVSLYASPLLSAVGRWVGSSGITLLLALPQFLIVQGLATVLATRVAREHRDAKGEAERNNGEGKECSPRGRRTIAPGLPSALGGLFLAAILATILATAPLWRHLPGREPQYGGRFPPDPGEPPALMAATVQPRWDYLSHPGLAAALRQGNANQVADILTQEAEEAAIQASDQGAKFVAWPLDYLNFDPGRDHERGPKLLALARSTGATLVIPYGYYTAEGPVRGVAVIGPAGISSHILAPGDLYPLTDQARRSAFLPVPTPVPILLSTQGGTQPWLALTGAFRSLRPGWQQIAAAQIQLTVAGGRRHPYPWGLSLDAAQAGTTLVFADWGKPAISPPEGNPGTIVQPHSLTLSSGPGPYARYGDLLGWVGVLSLLASIAAGRGRHGRRPTPPPGPNSRPTGE